MTIRWRDMVVPRDAHAVDVDLATMTLDSASATQVSTDTVASL